MNINDYISFAAANPVCYLATCDGDQPRVRTVLLFFADKTGFYFGTLSPKDLSKQLHHNPKVEVCFYNNPHDLAQAKQMRLTGAVEFVNDPEMIHRLHEARLYLDDISGYDLEPISEIFRVTAGDVHFWTLSDVMNEENVEHLVF
ncbi:pyridoxamine 5'-phosphate oxidase family protein [Draconibacterium sediminis]|uniref:pyridoxamine 5'-phosphate oxidase family protein n=1 Tax=Draconibacterium sediminis TaxID=1544798 RepID=UPI0026F2C081|nr:pyridoxamine 5'-phosphate oxidase family protein [Draconibacterium sediminis]